MAVHYRSMLKTRLVTATSLALALTLGACKDEPPTKPPPVASGVHAGQRHKPKSNKNQHSTEPVKRKSADWPRHGRYERFVKVGETKRRFLVQIPGNYDGWNTIPLMFVLHDRGGTPEQVAQSSMDITKGVAAAGYIAVFPEGAVPASGKLGSSWADGLCSPKPESEVDDIGFIRAILKDLTAALKIDEKRIFVMGIGNGGVMAHRVGAELSQRFSAVVAISAPIGCRPAPDGPAKTPPYPKVPTSVLMVHSDEDEKLPAAGGESPDAGEGLLTLPLRDAVTFWTRANKCEGEPVKDKHRGAFDSEIHHCEKTHSEVRVLILHGGDHGMPTRIGSSPAMKVITTFLDHLASEVGK